MAWFRGERARAIVLLTFICLAYLLVGLDKVNEASNMSFEDTVGYLEGALFIQEHGGVKNFLSLALTGEYKSDQQHPLYHLVLSPLASRDLVFFPKAQLLTLGVGLITVITVFVISHSFWGLTAALVSSALLAFSSEFMIRSSHINCEPLLILFSILGWYFIAKGFREHKWWFWAGVSSGLAYLTKASGLALVPVFCCSTLFVNRLTALKDRYFWLFFVGFVVTASPLLVRNVLVYHAPFHEGALTATASWIDKADDMGDPRYDLVLNYREGTYSSTRLPSMSAYLATHTIDDMLNRVTKGFVGEARILAWNMNLVIVPFGEPILGITLLLLGVLGLVMERDKNRRLLSLATIAFFAGPFVWGYQPFPLPRYLDPILPLVCMYAGTGLLEVVQWVDGLTLKGKLNFHRLIPRLAVIPLVALIAFELATQQSYPSLDPPVLNPEQHDLANWIRANSSQDDVLILGPTSHYWAFPWYAGLKGKVVPTPPGFFSSIERFEIFDAFLEERHVNLIVVHEENCLQYLKDYFSCSAQKGVVPTKPISGWHLIYSQSGTPPRFLIYRIDRRAHGIHQGQLET